MDKRQKPAAFCPTCKKRSYDIQLSNKRCVQRVNNGRCVGITISAIGINDWVECATCSGSGWIEGKRCVECANSGWLFVRKVS